MRLKQYDKAEKAISQALEVESHNATNLSTMLSQAKLLNLLAKVRYSRNYCLNSGVLMHIIIPPRLILNDTWKLMIA